MHPADQLLRRAVFANRAWLIGLALAAALAAGASLLLPAVTARAVDAAISGTGTGFGSPAVIAFLVVAVALVIGDTIAEFAQARCVADSIAFLRRRVITHVVTVGPYARKHMSVSVGDMISRVTTDAAEAGALAPGIVQLALGTVTSLGAIIALTLLHWSLGVVFVLGVPLSVLLARAYLRDTGEHLSAYQVLLGDLSTRLTDAINGWRTIRASGSQRRELERVLAPLPALHTAGAALWRSQARLVWSAALLGPAVEIAVVVTAGIEVAAGVLSVGSLLAAAGYAVLGMVFLNQASLLTRIGRSRACAHRLYELLTTTVPRSGVALLTQGNGHLELSSVWVRNSDEDFTLRGISLDVPAGATVAVVGQSGSGKSALAAVSGRLRSPDVGQVSLDGRDLAQVTGTELRAAVGYAFERPVLLGDTIAEAISYGVPVSMRQIAKAAKIAQVDEVISRLPDGYETPLRVAPLSGGEAQRIGLARAVLREPRLLVLDDATASLDTVTEAAVGMALTNALPGRTRVVVTHRAAVAARADLVVWLVRGRVHAVDSHKQLWRDSAYRAMFSQN
ncbi:ABC transporter ATP-binding protein [Pseudonocardiaceae bacterium YIM PH 21723]|nr:ABC transporter ATP-binding protein [Pseudonocardiaceae bacterium YIM PH 21723]